SHRELEVWKSAMELAIDVFYRSKEFPSEERFNLTDQIRRSSRSVATNISEAWRKRRYSAAFISKLSDAEGEAAETQTSAEIARRCNYWDDELVRELDDRYEKLIAQIVKMVDRPDQWCEGLTNKRST